MAKHLTTNTLISSVVRRAMLPTNQNTFQEADFLAFANEELDIGVVPHILSFHEDYLMHEQYQPVTPDVSVYELPYRATGNKVREIAYVDTSGNIFEMTRILVEDLPYYQNGSFGISNSGIRAFYIEGEEIVILPVGNHNLTGQLKISYYLRPNALVSEKTVSKVTSFNKYTGQVFVDNVPDNLSSPIEMDFLQTNSPHKRLEINLTPVSLSKADKYYYFGITPIRDVVCASPSNITSSSYFTLEVPKLNIKNVIWFDKTGTDVAPVVNGATNYVRANISTATTATDVASILAALTITYFSFTSAGVTLTINTTLVGTYSVLSLNDLLFTQTVTRNGTEVIPYNLKIGDVLAAVEECIIPNIPTELHSMLAQRIACRCLEAMGDAQGLAMANQKLAEMEVKTGQLLSNRVEGAPLKVVNRHGFLRMSRRMLRR